MGHKPMKRPIKLTKRMQDYLGEQSICCKSTTLDTYKFNLGHFYNYLKTQSVKNITSLTKEVLTDYLVDLGKRELGAYSKVNYLLAIKKYIAWEVENGNLHEDLLNVLDRSRLPPVPEYLPRPLSAENDRQLCKILRQSDHPYAPFFLLLRQTGMRISELINLPPDCVLTGSKNEKYLKVPLGKMNNERLVPLCDESRLLIEKIGQTQKSGKDNRLIGMTGSIPRVYAKLAHHFKKIIDNMTDQNKPVTFHRLRHAYATSLLTGGVSLPSLMKLLGHRKIEMTLRYAKVTPSYLRDEYLKAIHVLEKQSALVQIKKSEEPGQILPEEIIQQLTSFLGHAALIPSRNKKNLLLKLTRLRNNLANIPLSKNFILHVTTNP
jgi:site-specific recombinase XerD